MHQPPFLAHEEGMRGDDGQIVHHLRVWHNLPGLHRAIGAVQARHMLTDPQLTGRNPTSLLGEEWMLWRRLDLLAIECELYQDRVGMHEYSGYRIATRYSHCLVIREHMIADLERADRHLSAIHRDQRIRADNPPQQWVVVARMIVQQPGAAVEALAGEVQARDADATALDRAPGCERLWRAVRRCIGGNADAAQVVGVQGRYARTTRMRGRRAPVPRGRGYTSDPLICAVVCVSFCAHALGQPQRIVSDTIRAVIHGA